MGLGTAHLAGAESRAGQDAATRTVRAALAGGVTLLDTAPLYGAGLSEEHVGAALAGVPRQNYVLSTKVGRLIGPQRRIVPAYTRDGVLRSVEESLRRLGLERVDVLLIHDPDAHYRAAVDEVFPVLADLRAQGVVKAIGAGMNQWQMLADFARHTDMDCFLLAGRYTLLEHEPLDVLFPLCQQKGIGIFLGGVFNSGILATGARPWARYNYAPAPPEVLHRVARLEEMCERHGVPLAAAAIQFPLAHPAVTSVVLGAEAPREVQDNLTALHLPIPAALWADMREAGLIPEAAPLPGQPA